MTVSTEYFDSVYAIKQASEQRISRLSGNIARAEQKIELIKQRPLTAKRISRIERLETINASRLERIENFQDNITNYNAILPKDEFVPAYWVRDTGERWGVQVTVTDSPYDDTYIGGTTADLRLRGAGRITDYGVSGFGHTRGGIMANDYAPIDGTKTVGFGGGTASRDLSDYPQLSIMLIESDTNRTIWTQDLKIDGVDLI